MSWAGVRSMSWRVVLMGKQHPEWPEGGIHRTLTIEILRTVAFYDLLHQI